MVFVIKHIPYEQGEIQEFGSYSEAEHEITEFMQAWGEDGGEVTVIEGKMLTVEPTLKVVKYKIS